MKLVKTFWDLLSSAHFLPSYVGKCKQIHGHNYRLDVVIEGAVNPDTGMIVDFYDVERVVRNSIESKLDHVLLNDAIPNPTAENVVSWISAILKKELPQVSRIRLWEDTTSYVEVDCK